MKIYDKNQKCIGDIPKPKPIEQDGQWWEPVEYRCVEKGEKYFGVDGIYIAEYCILLFPRWIAAPIPRATPEKLVKILNDLADELQLRTIND